MGLEKNPVALGAVVKIAKTPEERARNKVETARMALQIAALPLAEEVLRLVKENEWLRANGYDKGVHDAADVCTRRFAKGRPMANADAAIRAELLRGEKP